MKEKDKHTTADNNKQGIIKKRAAKLTKIAGGGGVDHVGWEWGGLCYVIVIIIQSKTQLAIFEMPGNQIV